MALVFAFAMACSDDTESKPTKKDNGIAADNGIQLDGATKQDGPIVKMDTGPTADKGSVVVEGGAADLKVNTDAVKCTKAIVGKACTKAGTECGSGATCLLTSSDGASGVCTCACTPDNSSTPLINEDDCPEATTTKYSQCGSITLSTGKKSNFCFKKCSPTLGKNDCTSPMYCHPRSGASIGLYGNAYCIFSGGCAKDADCYVTNGKTCDTTDTTKKCTGTGETCQAMTSNGTAGICAVAGKCDTKSGICDKHAKGKSTAKVGDTCKSDLDCAGTQSCMIEFDEKTYLVDAGKTCKADSDCCSNSCVSGTCATGAPCRLRNRNGYCMTSGCTFAKTLTIAACDAGSVCNSLYSGGICQKSCLLTVKGTTTGSCRGNDYSTTNTKGDYLGDYECRGWNNLSIGGTAIVSKPVCDFGSQMSCDMLKNSSLDCSSVGAGTSNSTKMSCRGETDNKVKSTKYDATGLCLDDTPSGPIKK
jgi:hypothetical protein